MDFQGLPYQELVRVQKEVSSAIATRRAAEVANLRSEIEALITNRGFAVAEVFPEQIVRDKDRKVAAVRYRHPTQPGLTWTGRGKRPNWLRQFEEGGGTLEQCRVG